MDGMDFKINKDAMYVTVADKLEKLILSDSMGPNKKLPSEQSLATSFGVSRPVIREALKLLNARGLVTPRNGEGSFTCQPHTSMITDTMSRIVHIQNIDMKCVFDVRATLEIMAARQCAEHITDAGVNELREINARMQQHVSNPDERAKLDIEFHQRVARISQNPILEIFIESMASLLYAMIIKPVGVFAFSEDGIKVHNLIINALESGDPDLAEDAMRAHLLASMSNYEYAEHNSGD